MPTRAGLVPCRCGLYRVQREANGFEPATFFEQSKAKSHRVDIGVFLSELFAGLCSRGSAAFEELDEMIQAELPRNFEESGRSGRGLV